MLATAEKLAGLPVGVRGVRRARRLGSFRWGIDGGKVGVPVEPPAGGVFKLALGFLRYSNPSDFFDIRTGWLPVPDRQWPGVRGGDGPHGFSARTSVQAGETIVEVVGELDLATAPLLDEMLSRAGAVATGRVVVDVSHVTFMGVAGLSVLVGAHYLGESRAGLVVRGASASLRRVIKLTGLSFLLEDTDSAGAVLCQGLRGRNLAVGCRAAGLSVTDLFVAYFALGGTAHLGEVRAFLGGMDGALDGHQQDVAAHAVNERFVELGHRDCLLSFASDQRQSGAEFT